MLFFRLSSKFTLIPFERRSIEVASGYEQSTGSVYPAILFVHGKKIVVRRQFYSIKLYIYPANSVGNQNNATLLPRTYTV
jgi:hypothetical protein